MAAAEASVTSESAADEAEAAAPEDTVRPTPNQLAERAIAPVKPEYLCAPPARARPESEGGDAGDENRSTACSVILAGKKKSKRQLKKERQQEQKSVQHICPQVAKSGNVDSCPYVGKCRFSHDLDGFLAQKPDDLEGTCPFLKIEGACPYGVACRFSNTHTDFHVPSECEEVVKKSYEMNALKKDLQKLLWKNRVQFYKADMQLKQLGLTGKGIMKPKLAEKNLEDCLVSQDGAIDKSCNDGSEVPCSSISNVDCTLSTPMENTSLDDPSAIDRPRPSKKAKSPTDDKICSTEINGSCEMGNDFKFPSGIEGSSVNLCKVDLCPRLHAREKKLIDFRGKLYLAPLTTVGNLPFRRVCKALGADITCGEMAVCTNLLQGQASEWALLRRHCSEDLFGIQICGAYPDTVARTVELIERECTFDFIDINMGCPIDIIVNKGAGSALLMKPMRMKSIIQVACSTMEKPLTVKVRTGYFEGRNRVDTLISDISSWGANALTIHGRSRQQRYSKLADWEYIYECTRKASNDLQVIGNGDIFSHTDWNNHMSNCPELSSCMIARSALVKPWIFMEIKEQRHWDIRSGERFNIFKDFVNFGLEHWGSDSKGVETTRYFLLEWLSYTHRYIPVGLLDVIPQKLNWRPPSYFCRDDLETLMASDSAASWIRISEMLLGKVPDGFTFTPKHKSNAYDGPENG